MISLSRAGLLATAVALATLAGPGMASTHDKGMGHGQQGIMPMMQGMMPMMQGMMGNYMEQSKTLFVQMQEQMQKQTEQMLGALGLKR